MDIISRLTNLLQTNPFEKMIMMFGTGLWTWLILIFTYYFISGIAFGLGNMTSGLVIDIIRFIGRMAFRPVIKYIRIKINPRKRGAVTNKFPLFSFVTIIVIMLSVCCFLLHSMNVHFNLYHVFIGKRN